MSRWGGGRGGQAGILTFLCMMSLLCATAAFVSHSTASLTATSVHRQSMQGKACTALRMAEEALPALDRRKILGGVAACTFQFLSPGSWSAGAEVTETDEKATAGSAAEKSTSKVYKGSGADAKQRKGLASQASGRYRITDENAKAVEAPKISFPTSVEELKREYKVTKSGLYFKELEVGEGPIPTKGEVIELHYIGAVCDADKDGSYDIAEPEGLPEIYPSMPQGILKDSPRYDSSFSRGRTMKVRYGKAQLMLGLEEALADMKPGGSKLVFLTPEVGYACPPGKLCVSDLEVNERFAMYIKLVSVGAKAEVGG